MSYRLSKRQALIAVKDIEAYIERASKDLEPTEEPFRALHKGRQMVIAEIDAMLKKASLDKWVAPTVASNE